MASSQETMNRIGLIFIDLQKSFVVGRWMQSLGPEGVTQIKQAFSNCADIIKGVSQETPLLLTKCIFRQEGDMEFVPSISAALETKPYTLVIKPNTRIMDFDPETVEKWISDLKDKGIKTVVIGGCTTTSCVRESSTQLQKYINRAGLDLMLTVDLSLCGARNGNYVKRCRSCMDRYMQGMDIKCSQCEKPGESLLSPVDLAVQDIKNSGVTVVERFDWSNLTNQM